MGISGVLAGGTLLGICGLIAGLFATVAPMWLITRVELHNKLCWTGSGLWQTGFVWGQDIPEMGLLCKGETKDAYEEYCTKLNRTPFEESMCGPSQTARISMIMAQIIGAMALFSAKRFAQNRYRLEIEDYAFELRLAKILLALSVTCSICGAIGFTVVYSSQLFSPEHAHELSKDFPVPFESSQFGCNFQSPLRAANMLESITKSSPLNCLYGGPSFAMAAASFVCWSLASLFFLLLCRDVLRLQNALQMDPNARVTPKPPIRHPLLTEILYPRTYSLYGAMSRRFTAYRHRKFIVMTLPLATMLTATMFAVMMLMNGAAVQVFIRISSPVFSRQEWTQVLEHFPAHRVNFFAKDEEGLQVPQPTVIEIIEEVFDFTMLTSIKNFWDGKAYVLAILTAVFCAVWPYLRIVMHLAGFFIPMPEQHRGRMLTWLDSLGKWTMVNTFVLCFMGVAFHLQSQIRLRGILPWSRDLLDVGIEVSLGPRISTYIYVFGVLVSIVISEIYVLLHRKCRDWEEQRNYEVLLASADGSVNHIATAASTLSVEERVIAATSANVQPLIASSLSSTRPAPLRQLTYQHGCGYEALCDRHHNPLHGKGKFVYSKLAKVLVWVALGLTAFTTLAGMLQVSMAFSFQGVVGDVIVDSRDRRREYSLMSIGTSIESDLGAEPIGGMLLTGVFFLVSFVAPLLRLCGLAVLWFVPMRPREQRWWFHLLEMLESWSALDVYFVSTLAATLEIGSLSKVILGGSFPAVEKLVNEKFPQFGGLFVVEEQLLNGMFLVLTGVVFEKFMSLFIVAQTANAVAERIAEEKLALERNRGLPGVREENDMFRELEEHPETWQILSPAARYTSASANIKLVYSGLPRFVWVVGIQLGLMTEVAEGIDPPQELTNGNDANYFSLEGE